MPRYPEYQIHSLDTHGYGRIIQTIDGKFYDGWGNTVTFTLFGKEVSINVEGAGTDSTDGGNINVTNNTTNTNNTDLFKEMQDQIDALKKITNSHQITIENQSKKLEDNVPPGTIVMWGGSVIGIPDGWVLCDGSGLGVDSRLKRKLIEQSYPFGKSAEAIGDIPIPLLPDLRERFVVGAGGNNSTVSGNAYSVGDKGGIINNMLTLKNIPEHEHVYSVIEPSYGTQNGVDDNDDWGDSGISGLTRDFGTTPYNAITSKNRWGASIVTDGKSGIYTAGPSPVKDGPGFTKKNVNGTIDYHPDDPTSIENRPPYFALCYIIKL